MADRIAVVGGNLHIDTRPSQGARVTIPIPDTVSSSSMIIRTTR